MGETLIGVSQAYLQLPKGIRDMFVPYVPERRDDNPVSPKVIRLLAAQGNRCAYCGGHMRVHGSNRHARRVTLDHVVPRARGGRDKGNLLLSHRRCNLDKANRLPKPCELLLLEAVNAHLSPKQVQHD